MLFVCSQARVQSFAWDNVLRRTRCATLTHKTA